MSASRDALRESAKQELGKWLANRIDAAVFSHLTGQPMFDPTADVPIRDYLLFKDVQGGFNFKQHEWHYVIANGERERFRPDAIAHRDEAVRRRAICRLDGRAKEAEHWFNCQRFLEHLFKLEPV